MSRYTMLAIATIAVQLALLFPLVLSHSGLGGPVLGGYAIAVFAVVATLRSGSEAGCRFFRVLAIIAIPFLLMWAAFVLSHDDPDVAFKTMALVFLAALAIQVVMVITFKPGRTSTAPATPGLEGNAALMQDIHDRGRLADITRRHQAQRGRAMRAETDNVLHERRIGELEAENKKLRDEIRKLRTILADPFHDPIPMEEKI